VRPSPHSYKIEPGKEDRDYSESELINTMGVLTPSSSRTHKINQVRSINLKPHSPRTFPTSPCVDPYARTSQGNDPDEVRPVSAAVAAVFGPTPWYFMEYQLLQLEEHLRFDRYHVHDFQEINYKKWIRARIEAWVSDEVSEVQSIWLERARPTTSSSNRCSGIR
jgi:hypothetical protein